jgi:hypothetical protein
MSFLVVLLVRVFLWLRWQPGTNVNSPVDRGLSSASQPCLGLLWDGSDSGLWGMYLLVVDKLC